MLDTSGFAYKRCVDILETFHFVILNVNRYMSDRSSVYNEADLIGVNNDRKCSDVNLVVRQYDACSSLLIDKLHQNVFYVVERPMNDWITENILVLKALRRKYESPWSKTRKKK